MTPYRERLRAGHYRGNGADQDVDATAAAAEKASELGVDVSTIKGTGKDGRVTVADVETAASE